MRITFVAALLSSFSLAALAAPSDGKITVIQVDSQLKGSSSGANLKVTFTIKNKGNQAYNILNTPTSLLSTTLDTDKFNPVNRDTKQEPIFTGIQLKWDAEGSARDKNFFVLRPGEEVKVDHDITKRYDFSRSGSGPYTLSPSEFVEIVDSTGSIQLARLEPAPKGELRVGGRFLQMVAKAEDKVKQVAVKTGGNYNATAIRITNCPGREQVITNAALAANLLLQRAQDHLQQTHSQSLWNQAPTRTWFGIFTQSRSEKITQNMANIWSPFENVYKVIRPFYYQISNSCSPSESLSV
ncbi:hypothetical protein FRC10_001714 [Ceratobasidium sp. 414]|nr:hypothetical protein FRC10_001714 [Ceratobasidium sp. 414]